MHQPKRQSGLTSLEVEVAAIGHSAIALFDAARRELSAGSAPKRAVIFSDCYPAVALVNGIVKKSNIRYIERARNAMERFREQYPDIPLLLLWIPRDQGGIPFAHRGAQEAARAMERRQ